MGSTLCRAARRAIRASRAPACGIPRTRSAVPDGWRRRARAVAFATNHQTEGAIVSTILIGVDATDRSADAIAFGRRLAEAAGAEVIVACAYPYDTVPSRAASTALREALRDEAHQTAER